MKKKEIMENEGLKGWKLQKKEKGGGGLVLFKSKKIILGENASFAMFLHELTHAITGERHTGIFADKFTYFVDKYKDLLKNL